MPINSNAENNPAAPETDLNLIHTYTVDDELKRKFAEVINELEGANLSKGTEFDDVYAASKEFVSGDEINGLMIHEKSFVKQRTPRRFKIPITEK